MLCTPSKAISRHRQSGKECPAIHPRLQWHRGYDLPGNPPAQGKSLCDQEEISFGPTTRVSSTAHSRREVHSQTRQCRHGAAACTCMTSIRIGIPRRGSSRMRSRTSDVATRGMVACGTALGHVNLNASNFEYDDFIADHVQRRCDSTCEQIEKLAYLSYRTAARPACRLYRRHGTYCILDYNTARLTCCATPCGSG